MFRALLKIGLIVFILSIIYTSGGRAEVLSVDDPQLIAIREHVLNTYYFGSDPVDQCNEYRHRAASKLYTQRVSVKEQEDMTKDFEHSIINSMEDNFLGLYETLAALSSTKISYMFYWEYLYINSATYQNPLTGRTITLHTEFSPATTINRNYTDPETGFFYKLRNCLPFPQWVTKYYKNFVPAITRLEHDPNRNSPRAQFIKLSNGIGGKFKESIRVSDNEWFHDMYMKSSVPITLLLRGSQKDSGGAVTSIAWEATNYDSRPSFMNSEWFAQLFKLNKPSKHLKTNILLKNL